PLVVGHLVAGGAEPGDILDAELLVVFADQEALPAQDGIGPAQGDQAAGEGQQLGAVFIQVPVDPAQLVILAVDVVVTLLGAAELIAGEQHGRALGEQQGGHQVAHLPHTQFVDFRIVSGTFATMVIGQVVITAVLVVLSVGFVVLVVVTDHVAQGKTVVGRDEVHRRVGPTATLVVVVARGGQAACQFGNLAFLANPEGAGGIAEAVVPFHPARREATPRTAAAAAVSGFGDQFALALFRVLAAGN